MGLRSSISEEFHCSYNPLRHIFLRQFSGQKLFRYVRHFASSSVPSFSKSWSICFHSHEHISLQQCEYYLNIFPFLRLPYVLGILAQPFFSTFFLVTVYRNLEERKNTQSLTGNLTEYIIVGYRLEIVVYHLSLIYDSDIIFKWRKWILKKWIFFFLWKTF